jgi:uncharacterized protein (DUF2249 family)
MVTLDVRADIRAGAHPLGRIMQAVDTLGPRQALRLLAPFEPVPLYGLLAQRGFSHTTSTLPEGDYEVVFRRSPADAAPPSQPPKCGTKNSAADSASAQPGMAQGDRLEVDARGLEPPQPMVKVLEALAELPAGASLYARTDRRPMHLYAQLESRGFVGETEEQPDGTFLTHVYRR